MNFKDKKIVIMGLGTHGGGVEDALFFIRNGADVVITDLREEVELELSVKKIDDYYSSQENKSNSPVTWALGGHEENDFKNADLIIKNPAVPNKSPYLKIANENNVPVKTSIGVFMEIANTSRIIGITGTKGKSSTASLVHGIMKDAGSSVNLAGNIGKSPLSLLPIDKNTWTVLELSSWQLEGVTKSPHIAAITNIDQDHLDRYENYEEYVEAKKNIFKYQSKEDFLILNKDYLPTIFSEEKHWQKKLSQTVVLFSAEELSSYKNLPLHHHLENIACALRIAELLNIPKEKSLNTVAGMKSLSGRLELISNLGQVEVYNDTTATNPYATLRSIKKFKGKKIALVLGGEDKDLEYEELARELKNIHHVSLLPGSASDKIYSYSIEHRTWNTGFKRTKNLQSALKACIEADPDVILFSPAASSFNMFKDEFERGERFVEEIGTYAKEVQTQ